MLQTIEAVIEKTGEVRLLEPIHPTHPTHALVTILKPVKSGSEKVPLSHFFGSMKDSAALAGDPVAMQRNLRNEWD